jgi:hypothetical protein
MIELRGKDLGSIPLPGRIFGGLSGGLLQNRAAYNYNKNR